MGCDSLAGIVFHTRIATFPVEEKQKRQGRRVIVKTSRQQPGGSRTGTGQNKGIHSTRRIVVYCNIIILVDSISCILIL